MPGGFVEGEPPLVSDLHDLLQRDAEMCPRRPLADVAGDEDRRRDASGGRHIQGAPEGLAQGGATERPDDPRCPED